MTTRGPTILSVFRTQSQSRFEHDPHPLQLEHVDARMSDGSVARLYISKPGEVTLEDADLVGLTAEQARELAESRGRVLS